VRFFILLLALAGFNNAIAEVYLTEGTNISVDVSADGRAAIDLLGGLWILPADGGEAAALQDGLRPAQRPRWSPDADALVYQASTATHDQIWLHHLNDERSERLGSGRYFDQHPDWHPGGERIVFSSARGGNGFDLWEIDLPTHITWRLSDLPGNETEPAWSGDGRSLIYVHELNGQWSLMLRRFGQADEILAHSDARIAAPAWRPDGSLVTYMQTTDAGWSIRMAILSDPVLDRPLVAGEDFFVAPVAWLDRQEMLYTANGHIRKRRFNEWSSINIPFRAAVGKTSAFNNAEVPVRELPALEEPSGITVIRAGRLYDGVGNTYRNDRDIVIEGGRIAAVEDRDERPGAIVIDLGDVTVLPGYVDAYAALPDDVDESLGPLLLSLGITTMVAEHRNAAALNSTWSGKNIPGPRVLAASALQNIDSESEAPWLVTVTGDMSAGVSQRNSVRHWQSQGVAVLADSWQVGLGSGASLLIGAGTMPSSPGGKSYQDVQLASGTGVITFVSGLADNSTPGLDSIRNSRQALLLPNPVTPTRRFTAAPNLSAAASTVVLGSKPNGLQPGVALHAEFRALVAAGLSEEQALKAAGVNAAGALGLGLKLGRIATGAAADLVLVDGDPLNNIGDTLKIIGVVRNGRFFSVSGLIDRSADAKQAKTVE
jgi:hypothetical protein